MKFITKQDWIRALRSGEYKQTTRNLAGEIWDRTGNRTGEIGYCCLGVACKLVGMSDERLVEGEFWEDVGAKDLYFKTGIPIYRKEILAELNDDYGFTFEQIADVIESNFRKNVINRIKKTNEEKIDD